MEKFENIFYLIILIFGVGFLGVVRIVVGITGDQSVGDFTLNLATEFIGVALIYFAFRIANPKSRSDKISENLETVKDHIKQMWEHLKTEEQRATQQQLQEAIDTASGISFTLRDQLNNQCCTIAKKDETLENKIKSAKRQLWVSGCILDIFVKHADTIEKQWKARSKSKSGFEIKLLLVSDDPYTIAETSGYLELRDVPGAISNSRQGLEELARKIVDQTDISKEDLAKDPEKSPIQIKVSHHRLSSGYFIVDPNANGCVIVSPYLFNKAGIDAPILTFRKQPDSSEWFNLFLEDFDRLWKAATWVYPDKPDEEDKKHWSANPQTQDEN